MRIDSPKLLERVQAISLQFQQLNLQSCFDVLMLRIRLRQTAFLFSCEVQFQPFIARDKIDWPRWALHFDSCYDCFQRLLPLVMPVLPVFGLKLAVVLQPPIAHYKYNAQTIIVSKLAVPTIHYAYLRLQQDLNQS